VQRLGAFISGFFLTARNSGQYLFVPMIESRLPFSGMDGRAGHELLDFL
jgi:hypothetical protein